MYFLCTFCRPVATPSNTRQRHQDSISLSHSYTFASAIHFSAHNLHFAAATGRKLLLSYCLMRPPTDCRHQGTAPPRRPQHAWFTCFQSRYVSSIIYGITRLHHSQMSAPTVLSITQLNLWIPSLVFTLKI